MCGKLRTFIYLCGTFISSFNYNIHMRYKSIFRIKKTEIFIKNTQLKDDIKEAIYKYGKDIIFRKERNMKKRNYGTEILVALSILLQLHIEVDTHSLIRGALLHDYFLYDWHKKVPITNYTLLPMHK